MTTGRGRCRWAAMAVTGAAALVLAPACSGGGSSSKDAHAAATRIAATTTLPAPTTTAAASPRTTSTLPSELGPGPAHVGGSVLGPEGVVPGATVRVERLIDDTAVAATTVQAGPDGHWGVDSVNGGRYRLRAWRPPDLTQLTPVMVFVTVEDSKPVDLPVLRYPGTGQAIARVVPDPPVVGQPAILVIGAADGQVDTEGVLHSGAQPGVPVTVTGSTNVTVSPGTVVPTDANGNAAFQLVCNGSGPVTATVTVGGGQPQPVPLPACTVG